MLDKREPLKDSQKGKRQGHIFTLKKTRDCNLDNVLEREEKWLFIK